MNGPTTADGAVLWFRASVVALVALTTGAAAHVGAHGLLPGPVAAAIRFPTRVR